MGARYCAEAIFCFLDSFQYYSGNSVSTIQDTIESEKNKEQFQRNFQPVSFLRDSNEKYALLNCPSINLKPARKDNFRFHKQIETYIPVTADMPPNIEDYNPYLGIRKIVADFSESFPREVRIIWQVKPRQSKPCKLVIPI